MLGELLGALTIQTNKPVYQVGEELVFRIEGGFPNSMIAWTSFKDGVSTGEYQSAYPGQFLDAQGNLTLPMGAPWTESQVGLWEKQVVSINPDNPQDVKTAKVIFSVAPQGTGSAVVTDGVGFFNQQLLGFPLWLVLAVGAGAAFFLFKK